MVRDEEAERTETLTVLKEMIRQASEMLLEIKSLELRLETKRRLNNQLRRRYIKKLKEASLTPAEELDLWTSRPSMHEAISETVKHFEALQPLLALDATCMFDVPKHLQITIKYDDNSKVIIDVIKSLLKCPTNIRHPLIIQAIKRYINTLTLAKRKKKKPEAGLRLCELTPDKARRNLDRMLEAITQHVETTSREVTEALKILSFAKTYYTFPDDYFEDLRNAILNDSEIAEIGNTTKRIEKIRQRLESKYPPSSHPNLDHERVLEFLSEAGTLVRHSGGGDPLRNDYFSWLLNINPSSVRTRLSEKRRRAKSSIAGKVGKLLARPSFLDLESSERESHQSTQENEKLKEETLLHFLGIATMPPYEDLSTLVRKEIDASRE